MQALGGGRPPSHACTLNARSMLHARLAHIMARVRALLVCRRAHGSPQAWMRRTSELRVLAHLVF
eukprot:5812158-Alexandrium_andersonii.AAC.1